MSKYYSFPLRNHYDFVGKFSTSNDDQTECAGLIKCRPGRVISLQLAIDLPRDSQPPPEIIWGHIFEDDQLPLFCTLVQNIRYNYFAGLRSNGGVKEVGSFFFLIVGETLKTDDIISEYIYSSKIIQHFFCPNGMSVEKYSGDKFTLKYGEHSIEIFQHATMKMLTMLNGGEIISKTEGFRTELKALVEKHKDERGIPPGIKNHHSWLLSIKKDVKMAELDALYKVSTSLDTLFFVLTGHLSAPIGVKVKIVDGDKPILHDVILPIYDKYDYDNDGKDEDRFFFKSCPINIKSLSMAILSIIADKWSTQEEVYHYIVHILQSNYIERKSVHPSYIFARTVGALEALHVLDGVIKVGKQDKKVKYAIDNYASAKTIGFLENKSDSSKKIENALVSERAKIVHPKASNKEVWDNQKQHYNLTIALESILFKYIQQQIGVPGELSDQFQDKMIKRLLWR